MSTDPTLDALRAAVAKPADPDARSLDPRKPHLAAAARDAYVNRPRVGATVTVAGWNGTYSIDAVSRAGDEVRVAPLGTWVPADRVTVVDQD